MNKSSLLICSTAALLAASGASQAAVSPTPSAQPQSYADLLEPIANASTLLQLADSVSTTQSAPLQLAQEHHHHHHHHHHHFGFGFYGGGVAPYFSDCRWTWGRPYWNGYRWARQRVRVCD